MASSSHKIGGMTRRYTFRIGIAFALALLGWGCAAPSSKTQTFLDPLAYCAAVKTIDRPDPRYVGPASPEWIEFSLAKHLGMSLGPDMDALSPVTWRCAAGAVMACSTGLGMPCDARPSASRVPSRAAIAFCRAFPDIDRPLPNLGTGISAYQWDCHHGWPRLIGQQPDIDGEGYLLRYWYAIPPDDALSAHADPVMRRR